MQEFRLKIHSTGKSAICSVVLTSYDKIIQSNLWVKTLLVSSHLASGTSFSKYENFTSPGFCTSAGKPGKSWNFIVVFSRTGKCWKKSTGPGKF